MRTLICCLQCRNLAILLLLSSIPPCLQGYPGTVTATVTYILTSGGPFKSGQASVCRQGHGRQASDAVCTVRVLS